MNDRQIVCALIVAVLSLYSGIVIGEQDVGNADKASDYNKRMMDLIAPTAEERVAFAKEDTRRVTLLTGYVEGETTYETVCADWDVTTNAHWGILGYSKADGITSIHMGRDLNSVFFELQYGYKSIAVTGRAAMIGRCADKVTVDYEMEFTSDQDIQCVLRFQGQVMKENNCNRAKVMSMFANIT